MDGGAGAGAVKGKKTTSGGVMDVRSCTTEPVMEAVELGFITRILIGILGGLIGGEFFFFCGLGEEYGKNLDTRL